MIACLQHAYEDGSQVFVMGNGGSAATASHMAVDLGKTVLPIQSNGTRRFRVTSLTDNVPWITAVANDLGYEQVFAEQLRNHVAPGDVVIAITGSGNSPNVVEGVRVASDHGATTVALLGFDGGVVKDMVDLHVLVRSDHYGFIEDVHAMLSHLVTAFFKTRIGLSLLDQPLTTS
ncbi:MAG: SIS domain-containing protein [Actinomycetota bacterium]|nr:SIS domain-containing protein [Actinomycetota bacterium]